MKFFSLLFDWLDDKVLVILCILIFGVAALMLEIEGNLALLEKMAYGLLGMAVGKGLKK